MNDLAAHLFEEVASDAGVFGGTRRRRELGPAKPPYLNVVAALRSGRPHVRFGSFVDICTAPCPLWPRADIATFDPTNGVISRLRV